MQAVGISANPDQRGLTALEYRPGDIGYSALECERTVGQGRRRYRSISNLYARSSAISPALNGNRSIVLTVQPLEEAKEEEEGWGSGAREWGRAEEGKIGGGGLAT